MSSHDKLFPWEDKGERYWNSIPWNCQLNISVSKEGLSNIRNYFNEDKFEDVAEI